MTDIDIRDHSCKHKFDKGQQEFSHETIECGQTADNQIIRVIIARAENMDVVSVKVQNL